MPRLDPAIQLAQDQLVAAAGLEVELRHVLPYIPTDQARGMAKTLRSAAHKAIAMADNIERATRFR